MRIKDADGMANSAGLGQTAQEEQSDLGLHHLLRSFYPYIYGSHNASFSEPVCFCIFF